MVTNIFGRRLSLPLTTATRGLEPVGQAADLDGVAVDDSKHGQAGLIGEGVGGEEQGQGEPAYNNQPTLQPMYTFRALRDCFLHHVLLSLPTIETASAPARPTALVDSISLRRDSVSPPLRIYLGPELPLHHLFPGVSEDPYGCFQGI